MFKGAGVSPPVTKGHNSGSGYVGGLKSALQFGLGRAIRSDKTLSNPV